MTEPRNPISESSRQQLEQARQRFNTRSEQFETWRTAARSRAGSTCLAYERFATNNDDLAILEQAFGEAFIAGMTAN